MIELRDVSLKRGEFALSGVNLCVGEGEYGVLTGKTGSGKSSLLEVVAGLVDLEGGAVLLGGRDVTVESPGVRGVGFVPQDGGIFGGMRVFDQLGFALKVRGVGADEIGERVEEMAGYLGIEGLLGRRAEGLSGGEVQRVALGRALIFEPKVLLLDEPLSALDEETRGEIQDLLFRICREKGVGVLHVTHWPDFLMGRGDVFYRIVGGDVLRA